MGFDFNVKNDNVMYLYFFQFFLFGMTVAMPQKIAIDPYSPNIKCFDGKVIKSGQNNLIERTCPQGVTRCVKYRNNDLPKRTINGVAETPENFKNAMTFKVL